MSALAFAVLGLGVWIYVAADRLAKAIENIGISAKESSHD